MDDFLSRVLGVGKPKVAYDPEAPNEEEDSDNKQYDSDSEDEENVQCTAKKMNDVVHHMSIYHSTIHYIFEFLLFFFVFMLLKN